MACDDGVGRSPNASGLVGGDDATPTKPAEINTHAGDVGVGVSAYASVGPSGGDGVADDVFAGGATGTADGDMRIGHRRRRGIQRKAGCAGRGRLDVACGVGLCGRDADSAVCQRSDLGAAQIHWLGRAGRGDGLGHAVGAVGEHHRHNCPKLTGNGYGACDGLGAGSARASSAGQGQGGRARRQSIYADVQSSSSIATAHSVGKAPRVHIDGCARGAVGVRGEGGGVSGATACKVAQRATGDRHIRCVKGRTRFT